MIHQDPTTVLLQRVTSLRHLKFIITCYELWYDFEAKQMALARFLAATTSPTAISSVVVDFYAQMDLSNSQPLRKTLEPGSGWDALDNALSSSVFTRLRSVIFNVKAFYQHTNASFAQPQAEGPVDIFLLIPSLASCAPRLDVQVNLETIFSPTMTLSDYMYVSFVPWIFFSAF